MRESPGKRFVRNPQGCCYNWDVHASGNGNCYHTANTDYSVKPWWELKRERDWAPKLPTEDDIERWRKKNG